MTKINVFKENYLHSCFPWGYRLIPKEYSDCTPESISETFPSKFKHLWLLWPFTWRNHIADSAFPLPMTPGHVSDLSQAWASTLLSDFWSYINVTPYPAILKSKVKFYKYENQASISENQRQESPGGHIPSLCNQLCSPVNIPCYHLLHLCFTSLLRSNTPSRYCLD